MGIINRIVKSIGELDDLNIRMKLLSFLNCVNVILLASVANDTEGFVLDTQDKNFLWDVNRCSNINPIVDSKSIILTANGKWPEDKLCTAIRRDLKVTDEASYEMSTEFNNIAGFPIGVGHLGFIFNVWDDFNYDLVYKRVHIRDVLYGRVINGELESNRGTIAGNPAISSGNWYSLKIVVNEEKKVNIFLNDKEIGSFEATFTTRGYGGLMVATGFRNVVQFRDFNLSPVITEL